MASSLTDGSSLDDSAHAISLPPPPPLSTLGRLVAKLVPVLTALCIAVFVLAPFRTAAYFDVFEDDFFYYAVAARNMLAGRGSSFDGIHATNGYHPLWMLVCLEAESVFHGRALFLALALLTIAAAMTVYALAASCLRPFTTLFTAQCLAGYLAVNFAVITGGMEITLAVPLLFLLCRYRLFSFAWEPKQALIYGLLAMLAVFARLDAALFVVLLATIDLLASTDVPWKRRLAALGPFVAGMAPILIYLASNRLLFGSALPISSHAKQMRFHHGPLALPLLSLRPLAPELSTLVRPVSLCFALALPCLLLGSGRLPARARPVVWALLLFLPVDLGILSFSSDWPLWRWYLYPFLLCALGSLLVLLTRTEAVFTRRYFMSGFAAAALLLFAGGRITRFNWKGYGNLNSALYSFYFAANDLSGFAAAHSGLYAMGDRAGMVGYFLPHPLMQIEGLMMDKPFLENIRLQRDLPTVLRSYGVRYFIATNPTPSGQCWTVREPAQAGADAPAMRGHLCSAPVHTFESADHVFRTVVFDLQK